MTTLYVVTVGHHEIYRPVAIFDNRENAEAFREAFKCDAIEEHQLNPCVAEVAAGLRPFSITMQRSGSVYVYETSDVTPELPEPLKLYANGRLNGIVMARDSKHAIEIANHKRMELIKAGEWPE